MNKFKIGDKVVFKKEVLDAISKTNCVNSNMGCSLTRVYYNYLIKETNFRTLKYFEIRGIDSYNLFIGLYIGIDLFEYYQEQPHIYKVEDSIKVLEYSGKIQKATYFIVNFTEHTRVCSKIREKCSDFCKIAKDMGATICISDEDFFPEFPTIEQLVAFVNKINELYSQKPSGEAKQVLTTQKTKEHEIRFQKSKASCKRGTVPTGSTISGRKDKIAISIGHLSYQICNC